jgi:hypothetical protein
MILRRPRYGDKQFRNFLSKWQWSSLIHGKPKATASLNAAQASIWKHIHPG